MAVIKWSDGREFPLVSKLAVREMIEVEKALKTKLSEMGEGESLAAKLMISLRKNGIHLDMKAVLDLVDEEDFSLEMDEDEKAEQAAAEAAQAEAEEAGVPTTPGAEAGTSPRPKSAKTASGS